MANSNEYMKAYMLERYHRRRSQAIEILGGRCVDCGNTEQIEFDHVNPEDKSFNVAKAFTSMAEKKLWLEITKCALRCKPCHKFKTDMIDNAVGHGEGKTGKRNCRCDLCKPLKNMYAKEFRRNRKEMSNS